MDLGLDGRVVFVTGSSRGIGRASAELFGLERAKVVVTYRRGRADAEAVATTIRATGGDAIVVFLDLDAPDSILAATTSVLAQWGRIDVLVNNAVQWPARRGEAGSDPVCVPTEWCDLVRANVAGTCAVIDAIVPSMRKARWGRIVNVSSVAAVEGLKGFGWYSAAKSALHGLTCTLAKELGPLGILANVVMPGLTMTERVRNETPPAVRERHERTAAIRRLLLPNEVAAVIVFIGSAANTAITGQVIRSSGSPC